MYEEFQILIDDPSPTLSLGFDDYAAALTEVATISRPQFAIGIFGAWGSGKTTLMRAMETSMAADPGIVAVWFNAWRYEREEHLIVPLLDTLRERVVGWSDEQPPGSPVGQQGRRLAGVLGRAAKAILAGLTLKAGVPGVVEASLDANKVLTQWGGSAGGGAGDAADDDRAATEPKSFYHAAFLSLRNAVTDFLTSGTPAQNLATLRRFVVFVDDLDRCLPEKALEVLESMKLFFDLEGFVFVVGLDQRIIERAVQLKYPLPGTDPDGNAVTYVNGADYVKKIFQIQFTAPRVDQSQLSAYLEAVAEAGRLPQTQRDDLRSIVAPQIANLVGSSSVNPREVKRLINAYTMQMKILERKLGASGRAPSAATVLGLQIMSFRPDWQPAYEALSDNPADFVDATSDAIRQGSTLIAVDEEILELPASVITYLQHDGAAVLHEPDLEIYVSSLESARTTDPIVREVSQMVGALRVMLRTSDPTDAPPVRELLSEISYRLDSHSDSPSAATASQRLRQVITDYPVPAPAAAALSSEEAAEAAEAAAKQIADWLERVGKELAPLGQAVADLRRRMSTSGPSVA